MLLGKQMNTTALKKTKSENETEGLEIKNRITFGFKSNI